MINWNNLKEKKCPLCGRRLLMANLYMRCSGRKGGVYKVSNSSLCKFTINKHKYADLGGFIPEKYKGTYNFLNSKELEELEVRRAKFDGEKKERRKLKKLRYQDKYLMQLKEAKAMILDLNRVSIPLLQRNLKIERKRALKIMGALEHQEVVGKHNGCNPREIFINNIK